jgi:hypothetical protein
MLSNLLSVCCNVFHSKHVINNTKTGILAEILSAAMIMHHKYLAARLRPDPLGELIELPRTHPLVELQEPLHGREGKRTGGEKMAEMGWIAGKKGRIGKEGKRKGKERKVKKMGRREIKRSVRHTCILAPSSAYGRSQPRTL